jgi:hypothetical protein
MPKWIVVTIVTSECTYEVDADDEKSAEAASAHASPVDSRHVNEETMSITTAFASDR